MRNAWRLAAVALAISACGCAGEQKGKEKVDAGEVALGGKRYEAAVADANDALKDDPSAEAYYLRARAEEDRPKPDTAIEAADLAKAKGDYQAALALNPGQPLNARCRAGLANIAFTSGDYSTALFEWTNSMDHLDRPEWKAYALYRIGECQQRLGRFDDADRTFEEVARKYPDEDVAAKAKAHEGVRGFYVQVGAFTRHADAKKALDAADATMNAHGASRTGTAQEVMNGSMMTVRLGPFTSYSEATKRKNDLANQYPDAIVTP